MLGPNKKTTAAQAIKSVVLIRRRSPALVIARLAGWYLMGPTPNYNQFGCHLSLKHSWVHSRLGCHYPKHQRNSMIHSKTARSDPMSGPAIV